MYCSLNISFCLLPTSRPQHLTLSKPVQKASLELPASPTDVRRQVSPQPVPDYRQTSTKHQFLVSENLGCRLCPRASACAFVSEAQFRFLPPCCTATAFSQILLYSLLRQQWKSHALSTCLVIHFWTTKAGKPSLSGTPNCNSKPLGRLQLARWSKQFCIQGFNSSPGRCPQTRCALLPSNKLWAWPHCIQKNTSTTWQKWQTSRKYQILVLHLQHGRWRDNQEGQGRALPSIHFLEIQPSSDLQGLCGLCISFGLISLHSQR